ncbi:Hypothetical protein, putative [Bodo saltans]|uniref:Ubiquitin hydrolase n=1 Tax=Bodo saltans TaxID=75058 RepID=A0A0S4JPF3_BODSA|nr:Hypothetical protein, putative [Bodo saltans]|eukprot:CUG92190.1 Hypothetical protein, putative [Bodo saltans]
MPTLVNRRTGKSGGVTFVEGDNEGTASTVGTAKSSLSHAPLTVRRKELEKLLGTELPDYPAHVAQPSDNTAQAQPPPPTAAAVVHRQPFVGLTNLGATCYMNSLLQTLYTTPELRKHVVEFPFDTKQRHARNVAFHLQQLFSKMQDAGIRNHSTTKELMESFGMGGDAHREQHDVQELNRVLMDVLQEFIDRFIASGASAPSAEASADSKEALRTTVSTTEGLQVIRSLYQGHLRDVMKCANCHHTRASETPYLDLVLPLCSMLGEAYDEESNIRVHSLEDCLDRYVAHEVIDGVDCDACGGRHPLEKYQQFSAEGLPRVLTTQLLRLQYNIETGRRDKVQKDISLPTVLDMRRWCGDSSSASSSDVNSAVETRYRLHAIICHRGTAYHGHYYAFVCCYPSGFVDEVGTGAVWYKFDDETVSVASPDEILEYTDPATWKACRDAADATTTVADDEANNKKSSETASGVEAAVVDEDNAKAAAPSTAVAPTNPPEFPTVAELQEVENWIGFDFDVLEASAGGGGPTNSKRPRTISGHSYYALYRRFDMPLVTGAEHFAPPLYIQEALLPEQATLKEQRKELDDMALTVPISIWLGDVDRALTSQYQAKQQQAAALVPAASKSAATSQQHPPPYQLAQIWVNAQWTWSVEELIAEVKRVASEDDVLMEDPWVVELLCSENAFLRTYYKDIGTMGEHAAVGTLLAQHCSRKRNVTNHFALHIISAFASEDEIDSPDGRAAEVWTNWLQGSKVSKADNPFHIFPQCSHVPSEFPMAIRQIVSMPHGCSVEEAKVLIAPRIGIPAKEQVLTAVYSLAGGDPVIRTTGILVGDPIYVERADPARPVTNISSGNYDAATASTNKCVEEGEINATTGVREYATRAMVSIFDSYKMDVEYFEVPHAVEDNGIADYIRNISPEKVRMMRVDRRSTVRNLKLRVIHENYDEFVVKEKDAQLWFHTSPEPKNVEATLYTMCLGAARCRVALVHRPVLAENERMAEVYLMPDPLDYLQPMTLLKRVQLGSETSIGDVIRQAFPADEEPPRPPQEPTASSAPYGDEEELSIPSRSDEVYWYRPRLVPPGKSGHFGPLLWNSIVVQNAKSHPTSEVLKIVLQRLKAPEPLMEKGSIILHAHLWNSSEPSAGDFKALGVEREVVFNKELPAFCLKEQLSELFGIPMESIQAAPAKLYMLKNHESAFSKVAWEVLSDEKTLQRAVAAHPLSIEQDEIIVVRRREDPWPLVDDATKENGYAVTGQRVAATSSKFGGRRPKSPVIAGLLKMRSDVDEDTSSDAKDKSKKKARSEAGITIRAVWEYEAEEGADLANAETTTTTGDESAKNTNHSGEGPAGIDSAFTEWRSAPAKQSAPPKLIDFLESCQFDSTIHAMYETACRICYGDFEDNETICILTHCAHIFHKECLGQWFEQKSVCPMCGVNAAP